MIKFVCGLSSNPPNFTIWFSGLSIFLLFFLLTLYNLYNSPRRNYNWSHKHRNRGEISQNHIQTQEQYGYCRTTSRPRNNMDIVEPSKPRNNMDIVEPHLDLGTIWILQNHIQTQEQYGYCRSISRPRNNMDILDLYLDL